MIDVIVTSYKEPKATLHAVQTILKQLPKKGARVIVADPFPEVEEFLNENLKDERFVFWLDPGEGKSYALNILFQEFGSSNQEDIFILTDGDVSVSKNAISEIKKAFEDNKVGCVTGKPVAVDSRNTKYGFWAHFAFEGVHRARARLSRAKKFFECSGYLFSIRKGVIMDFPMETSEDSIIPYLFWKKGFRIEYVPEAEVYVKNPANWKDWLAQKVRNIKAHENLNKIAPDMPRTKSFFNEIRYGWHFVFVFPRSLKEFLWALELYPARLYLYWKSFRELRKKSYKDGWRETEIESTKPMD